MIRRLTVYLLCAVADVLTAIVVRLDRIINRTN